MRALALSMVAMCGTAAPPVAKQLARDPAAAWQSFEVGPFRSTFSRGRADWPANVHEPPWIENTAAGLAIAGYDGTTLTGEVELWTTPDVDPTACAAEVVWDAQANRGVRIETPSRIEPGPSVHAHWQFTASLAPAPQIVQATAYVFCPIDAAHRTPPWGATFYSLDMPAVGPGAHDEYCAKLRPEPDPLRSGELAGKQTMDLGFACGVLPRLRGRQLVDDCRGDVLLELDAVGPRTELTALASGSPLDDEELRHHLSGSRECKRVALSGFDPMRQAAFDAAIRHAGARIVYVGSRDGMIQP